MCGWKLSYVSGEEARYVKKITNAKTDWHK